MEPGHPKARDCALQRVFAAFASADADSVFQIGDKQLAVADLTRLSGLQNRVDHGLQVIVRADDFDLDLGNKVDRVLGSSIDLRVAFLAPKTAHFADRHAMDTMLGERILDVFELKVSNDRFNFFHGLGTSVNQ